MTEGRPTCGKCGGEMQPGFLMDMFHKNLENVEQVRWVAGDADERTSWGRSVKLGRESGVSHLLRGFAHAVVSGSRVSESWSMTRLPVRPWVSQRAATGD